MFRNDSLGWYFVWVTFGIGDFSELALLAFSAWQGQLQTWWHTATRSLKSAKHTPQSVQWLSWELEVEELRFNSRQS